MAPLCGSLRGTDRIEGQHRILPARAERRGIEGRLLGGGLKARYSSHRSVYGGIVRVALSSYLSDDMMGSHIISIQYHYRYLILGAIAAIVRQGRQEPVARRREKHSLPSSIGVFVLASKAPWTWRPTAHSEFVEKSFGGCGLTRRMQSDVQDVVRSGIDRRQQSAALGAHPITVSSTAT